MYDKAQKRIFYSRNIVFNETRSTKQDDVEDVAEDEPYIELEMDCQSEDDNTITHHTDEEPQQERRERRPPDKYGEWVYIAQEEDPVTAKEALSSQDAAKWRKAMEIELQPLHKNQVWELSELPPGRTAIGSKWVFKRKHDTDGNVKRYKARLVAQGYNQKYGIDYDETFCPVVRFGSVRTLITLAARHKLQHHQLDVATAFLNGELKEEIYIKQREQFEVNRSEALVCKFK